MRRLVANEGPSKVAVKLPAGDELRRSSLDLAPDLIIEGPIVSARLAPSGYGGAAYKLAAVSGALVNGGEVGRFRQNCHGLWHTTMIVASQRRVLIKFSRGGCGLIARAIGIADNLGR